LIYSANCISINPQISDKLAVNGAVLCLVVECLQGNVGKLLFITDGEYLLFIRLYHGDKDIECADVKVCKYANEVMKASFGF
jgi:hypothetical protein